MPKAFSEHEKKIIAERLLEQGYRQFSQYGLKKTNVEDLAKAAGISKGAFYGFYESKEALFMDVIEAAERRVRLEILAAVELPGPSARARLYAVLKKAFEMFEAIPLLQITSGSDYEALFRKIPEEKLHQHLASDREFFTSLIEHCRAAGIPIQAGADEIASLIYPLVPGFLDRENFGWSQTGGNLDLLLELIAAYCLGEVELRLQPTHRPDGVTTGEVQ